MVFMVAPPENSEGHLLRLVLPVPDPLIGQLQQCRIINSLYMNFKPKEIHFYDIVGE
jgi:hypothetical protein